MCDLGYDTNNQVNIANMPFSLGRVVIEKFKSVFNMVIHLFESILMELLTRYGACRLMFLFF